VLFFDELNIPKVGTAYEDVYLILCSRNIVKKSAYFVVELTEKWLVRRVLHLWRTRQQVFRTKNVFFARNSWFRIGSAMTKCLETAKTSVLSNAI
jgi:putative acetyltransferase